MRSARSIKPSDTIAARNIHEEFYKSDFSMPNLIDDKNLLVYVVPNDKDNPITIGIARVILELVSLTDLSAPVVDRKDALITSLMITRLTAYRNGFDQIHAFVQDPKWADIMKKKSGFSPCNGEALYLNV